MHKEMAKIIILLILIFTPVPAAAAEVLVQVMSVSEEAMARKEADRLFDVVGVPAFTRIEQIQDLGTRARVYIGPFETESDAAVAAETLKKNGTIKEYLIKVEKAPTAIQGGGEPSQAAIEDELAGIYTNPDEAMANAGNTGLPSLPVAETPTYGEPVSPEQARELGLYPAPVSPANSGQIAAIPTPTEDFSAPAPGDIAAGAEVRPTPASIPALPPVSEGLPATGQDLPTYGQNEAVKTKTGSLPGGLSVGDNMPGLALPPPPQVGSSTPNPAEAYPTGSNQPINQAGPAAVTAAPPTGQFDAPNNSPVNSTPYADENGWGNSSSAPAMAPSAGDEDGASGPMMVAQANLNAAPKASSVSRAANPGPMTLAGFTALVDLSSSMRRMSNCQSKIKEEAVGALLRKMNHRIPSRPYTASLRVFGYKMAVTFRDFTTLYYGPATYNRDEFEDAIAKLIAADAVSPFASAINEADGELQGMGTPKGILMFADFEESLGSGTPVRSAANARRRYGSDLSIYTFYITRQNSAIKLAKEIAKAGGGQAYDICLMLSDDNAFESMMMDIFGPSDAVPCADADGDGVCDEDDLCPRTPSGAPVDERGCWIAAYSQFFDFDKSVVKSSYVPRIQHAAEIMKNNPGLPRLVIAGHTDNQGSAEYNMGLGKRRAQAVFELMVKNGVAAERMVVESFGQTKPVAPNDTEEGRARNRRVEFHIGEVPAKQSNNF